MKKVTRGTLLIASLLTSLLYHGVAEAATLLPNGEQTFVDQNGVPVAVGCVYFFQPGTSTPKDTYLDPAASAANTNPVILDAAGRAIIYGVGTYRQVVQQPSTGPTPCTGTPGSIIWDQLTADSSAGGTIYAGASGGTPNTITLTTPSFMGTDGQVINYISTNTNTAAATVNPSGFGAVQIVRDSATGPGALIGGELVATNSVSLIYDATAGTFHILSPVTWPNTSGVPVGTVISVSGFTAPTNYVFANGQAVSRTTFSALFANQTLAQTGTLASGSPTITALADTTQLGFGMPVEAVGIPGGATILSCAPTTCTLSANATSTRSGTMTFFAYGNGDGSTTFSLPDYRGVTLMGRDNLGGTAVNLAQVSTTIATTSASATATVGSAAGLGLGMFVLNTSVTPGTTITAINGTSITLSAAATGTAAANAARFSQFADPQSLGVRGGASTMQIVTVNLPPYTPGVVLNVGNVAFNSANIGSAAGGGNSVVTGGFSATGTIPIGAGTFTGWSVTNSPQGGLSIPVLMQPPRRTVNYAIRLVP